MCGIELPQPGECLFQRSTHPSERSGLFLRDLIVENVGGSAIEAKIAGHGLYIAPRASRAPDLNAPTTLPAQADRTEGLALALGHRDADAADLALGLDLHDLLGAGGAQVQRGGKAGGLDEHADLAAACGALQIAEDVAAFLAPIAGDALTLAGDVRGQVELVAVAGAMQRLLQAHARRGDLVVGLAADVLGSAVGQRDRAVTGPRTVEAGKRSARLGITRRHRQ